MVGAQSAAIRRTAGVPVAEKELEPFAADLRLQCHRSSTISFGIRTSTACQRKKEVLLWYSMIVDFHYKPSIFWIPP